MEIAAVAIAFTQGISMIATSVRTLHSIRQAPIEFMDLLNQLSTLNGRAELLRRSLDSLAGVAHSNVPDVDIDTIRNLQVQFEEISSNLNDTATKFIAKSKGLDHQGRHRIPRVLWQREQSNLMRLRERVKQLSSDMTDCLAAINASQGMRQTGLVLNVRAVMEQSFTDVTSQIQHGNALTEHTHASVNHAVQKNESQTALLHSTLASHQETGATISRRPDILETRVETQLSQVMAHSNRGPKGSRIRRQFDHTVISVSTTLRPTCPPNCRCQCHGTSYARSPGWLSSVMGSLFVQYKSIPMLGMKKCDTPLCQSSSQSSLHLQWSFPRWLIARALVASISWNSINDDGAALFLKIPRSINDLTWLVSRGQNPKAFIQRLKNGTIRPTDILAEWGQTFVTFCIEQRLWPHLEILFDWGFDPRLKDLTGRCAIHWARQKLLQGYMDKAPEKIKTILAQISAMELEDEEPLTMIHQAIRGETTYSLDECIQMEPQHINTPDDVGFAPLHWVLWKDDMAAFETLMQASANVNQKTSHGGRTPLHFICAWTNVIMVRELIDSGASVSALDNNKWTPLHDAVNIICGVPQEMDVVETLLDAHADPNCGDWGGSTPLHILFINDELESDFLTTLARTLMDAGADLEAKDMVGQTVLLYACTQVCRNIPILIDLGANVRAVDDGGESLVSKLLRNEDDLEPSLLNPELLVGINVDARDKLNWTPLETLASRVRDTITWQPVTIRVVVDMVDLILGIREANWKEGLFLDNKQKLEADGSHARMRHWVLRQRQLMQRDDSLSDLDCEECHLRGWYDDKYNESSASDIDDDEHHLSDGSISRDWQIINKGDPEEDKEDGKEDDDDNGNERG
ncbi:hypothetical protein CEP51_002356 [Fusarium floridanum]|uniref:Uncharacterized protein n=1 Tax=Fusarium floridanum TaxID=1325733 RepID=A0A428SBP2_9HYPO|nr:hypothetical protein CEP51_002356 [Fusarium floridanum]